MATIHDPIKAEIAAGHTSAALAMIDERMAHDDEADRAGLLYLKGRAYMKAGVWHKAMNAFMQAEQLDPQSPAAEARGMLEDILDFYHKDLYNP
ncbi:hypothetical protein IMSAGC014_00055 [Bacteroidaceae bacterium]|jgi:Flp pilus assembly protein TadD|uniref:hypothetical protein n=1 Tax=Prevotella sp. MGM2 TaxID=2033406 RepID=UPI000D0C42FE|nr:hypothetical protein [Prevotella sp. MGM2]GAY31237.1 tetratricopeptide repeat protein [Prevotella sp. MGM2]GFI33572.1 hypothetical protein IMSAGC014_00055 [Bacteroidaceae bacterium]